MSAESAEWAAEQDEPVYRFPVEVEVVGELGEQHLRQVAKYVFDQLHTTLRNRG
ncbi:hypothetical protein [Nocardia brasiliensis]|uniref:hypothetical protein n=1 Tax=Nocardia brasiliensis TaxID=37326 RepID=UPI002458088E|nr:hypothetical protein [Nocardia brasiliensis]